MTAARARDVYEAHVRALPPAERLELMAIIARELTERCTLEEKPLHSIMELEGLGKEVWEEVDAQEYVRKLRGAWDHGDHEAR
jgi:hypothetical protein